MSDYEKFIDSLIEKKGGFTEAELFEINKSEFKKNGGKYPTIYNEEIVTKIYVMREYFNPRAQQVLDEGRLRDFNFYINAIEKLKKKI